MKACLIEKVVGREILDSRGNPTVEAEVFLRGGAVGRAAAPSGASTGQYEALELRDGDKSRYGGKGVQQAAANINTVLDRVLRDMDAGDIFAVDRKMREADGTEDKSHLGANALLAVSAAAAKAAAAARGVPLYRFLGGAGSRTLPVPMMNILNGGAHAANTVDVQEFMIMPVGAPSFREGLRQCAEVFHSLQAYLKEKKLAVSVGDEGGFAPDLPDEKEAIEMIIEAIGRAGYRPGEDFVLALDAAASEWKTGEKGQYRQPKSGRVFSTEELIGHWEELCRRYPIFSVEDALDEEDWDGWQKLTRRLGSRVQLVGDDLFVTNTRRIDKGIRQKCGTAVLIKPNQIGTLSETLEAVQLAGKNGLRTILSHRSGETEDTLIADIAVALNTGQIKTGAPSRGERTAKYNRLLRIEEELGGAAVYPGRALTGF